MTKPVVVTEAMLDRFAKAFGWGLSAEVAQNLRKALEASLAPEDEIPLTPEMIRAGAEQVGQGEGVAEIYRAMESVRRKAERPEGWTQQKNHVGPMTYKIFHRKDDPT